MSAPELSRLLRGASHIPLAASGLLQRFAEDPARGMVALTRAVPRLVRRAEARGPVAHFDRLIAQDRYAAASEALAEVGVLDPRHRSCELALRACAGALNEVADVEPSDRRSRRVVRLARQRRAVLSAPLVLSGGGDDALGQSGIPVPGRVLHVVTNSLPRVQAGSTIRTQRVLEALRSDGWDAQAATRPGFPVLHGDMAAADTEWFGGVPYHRLLPTVVANPQRAQAQYGDLLAHLCERLQPAALHGASDHANGRAAVEVGRRRGVPVAYEVRAFPEDTWLARHRAPGAERSDLYTLMRDRHAEVIRSADVITTLGEHMKDEVVARGVDPARIFVVPNGVDPSMLAQGDRVHLRDAARSRVAVEGGDLLLGSVTTMYEYEGLLTLVEAAAVMRRSGVDVRVMITGTGPAVGEIRARAEQLSVPLHLPGQVPHAEVLDYFDALDVFCLPRVDDIVTRTVTGLKPLEAQARGLPVVGSDLPAVVEVLADGSDTAPADDANAWAQLLMGYLDPAYRDARGRRAREWVEAHRLWAQVIQGYRVAYATVGLC